MKFYKLKKEFEKEPNCCKFFVVFDDMWAGVKRVHDCFDISIMNVPMLTVLHHPSTLIEIESRQEIMDLLMGIKEPIHKLESVFSNFKSFHRLNKKVL